MTEEQQFDLTLPEQQIAKPVRTLEALLKLYAEGHRNFSGSDLRGVTVDIIEPEIQVLNLQDIILCGSNLKAIKLERRSHKLKVDLTGADLSKCNLQGSNLSRCRLDQCNFTDSNLTKVNFLEASCLGSDFIKAKFYKTGINGDFTASDFTGADLRSAGISGNFSYAIFCGANLEKASFSYFYAHNADFSNSNLQDVEFPTPTTVTFDYSYYNCQTKLNNDFNPISKKMEFIENNIQLDEL